MDITHEWLPKITSGEATSGCQNLKKFHEIYFARTCVGVEWVT
jgi:hypothetical protein